LLCLNWLVLLLLLLLVVVVVVVAAAAAVSRALEWRYTRSARFSSLGMLTPSCITTKVLVMWHATGVAPRPAATRELRAADKPPALPREATRRRPAVGVVSVSGLRAVSGNYFFQPPYPSLWAGACTWFDRTHNGPPGGDGSFTAFAWKMRLSKRWPSSLLCRLLRRCAIEKRREGGRKTRPSRLTIQASASKLVEFSWARPALSLSLSLSVLINVWLTMRAFFTAHRPPPANVSTHKWVQCRRQCFPRLTGKIPACAVLC